MVPKRFSFKEELGLGLGLGQYSKVLENCTETKE